MMIQSCSQTEVIKDHQQQLTAIEGYPRSLDLTELQVEQTSYLEIETIPTLGNIVIENQFNEHWFVVFYTPEEIHNEVSDEFSIVAIDHSGKIIARKTFKIFIQDVPSENDTYGHCQGNLFGSAIIKADSVLTIDLMDNAILCKIGAPIDAVFSYQAKEHYEGLVFYISEKHQIMLYQYPQDGPETVEFNYQICYVFSDTNGCPDHNQDCDPSAPNVCQVYVQSSVVIEVVQ